MGTNRQKFLPTFADRLDVFASINTHWISDRIKISIRVFEHASRFDIPEVDHSFLGLLEPRRKLDSIFWPKAQTFLSLSTAIMTTKSFFKKSGY